MNESRNSTSNTAPEQRAFQSVKCTGQLSANTLGGVSEIIHCIAGLVSGAVDVPHFLFHFVKVCGGVVDLGTEIIYNFLLAIVRVVCLGHSLNHVRLRFILSIRRVVSRLL